MDLQPVNAPRARETFEEWIGRGDAIGVFVNADLSSAQAGTQVYLPLTPEEQRKVEVNRTRAPDSASYGLGWRYLLRAVVVDAGELEYEGPSPRRAP